MRTLSLLRHKPWLGGRHRIAASVALTVFSAAAATFTAPWASASTVPTTGLTLVQVTSHEALPPPYKPGSVFLKTSASLAAFAAKLHSDNIGVHLPPTGPDGCTGGTRYTAEVTYKTGHKTFLDEYECAGAVSGNLTGNVKPFLNYLSTLLK
jgi:hypothetical protein